MWAETDGRSPTIALVTVPQGRLNLAQDGVLGRDSGNEKSRRDDWKLPAGYPARFHPKISADSIS
jgi:hypothetical protein